MNAITFRRLEAVSFTHSTIYLALLVCAFVASKPQPETFVLGLTHGLLWIGMSLVCIAAARARIPSLQHGRRFEMLEPMAEPTHLHVVGGPA